MKMMKNNVGQKVDLTLFYKYLPLKVDLYINKMKCNKDEKIKTSFGMKAMLISGYFANIPIIKFVLRILFCPFLKILWWI